MITDDAPAMNIEGNELMLQSLVSPKSHLRDGGEREVSSTGGKREPTTGKGRYDLISPIMMRRLAIHYENGAKKYDERNWEKGLSISHCVDSLKRHIDQYIMGDRVEDHLAAVIWNASAIMHYEEAIPKDITDVHDLHPVYQLNVWPKEASK